MPGHRRISVILLSAGVVCVTPLPGQAITGNAGIRGTISTSDGRPLAGALVLRPGTRDTAVADSLGRYAIARLALGRHIFLVRRPGYQPIEMEVTFTGDTTITVNVPLELSRPVSQAKLEQVGFLERHRQPAPGATFLGPEEIAVRAATRTSMLFDGVRDITMRQVGDIVVAYGHDTRCVMNVWIDGRKVENVFPPQSASGRPTYMGGSGGTSRRSAAAVIRYPGLDELIQVSDIAAIEVYPRPTRTPAQFQSSAQTQEGVQQFETRSSDCGAIIIWSTREQ